jgi:hypothetical protein
MGPQIVPVQFRMLLVLRVCAECVCVCVCCKQKYVELNPCVRGFCVSELPARTHAQCASHTLTQNHNDIAIYPNRSRSRFEG